MPFFNFFSKNTATTANKPDDQQLSRVFDAAEKVLSKLQREEAELMLALETSEAVDAQAGINARLSEKRAELTRLQDALKVYKQNNHATNFSNLKNLVLPDNPLAAELPVHLVDDDEEEANFEEEKEDSSTQPKILELSHTQIPVVPREPLAPSRPIGPTAEIPVPQRPAKQQKTADTAQISPPVFVTPKTPTEVKEREIPINNQTYTETIIKKAHRNKDQIIHKAEGESLSTQNRQQTIFSIVHENMALYKQNIYLQASSQELIDQALVAVFTVDPHYNGKIHITGLDEAATNEKVAALKKYLEPREVKKHFAKIVQDIASSKAPAARP